MRPSRWTLRARLVIAILGLTTLALALANVVGIVLLRDNLMQRVDDQLNQLSVIAKKGVGALPVRTGSDVPFLDTLMKKRIAAAGRIYVFTSSGILVGQVPNSSEPGPVFDDIHHGDPYTVRGTAGTSWRIKAIAAPDGHDVVITQSLAEVEQTQTSLIAIALAVSLAVLLLLGLAADAVVRLGLRPLTRMERTAVHIGRGDFARRVPAPDPHTEPGRLGTAMNVMLDRVESEIAARRSSESRMRRFLADVSHELRTPLTSMRGFAELHRRGGGDTGEMMRRIEDEAARMGVLVNDLLTLAQLDQERPVDRHPVDLLEIAADTIRDARARVPDRQVRLAPLHGTLTPVSIVGDEARLRQVAANLVGNALTHTPPDADVTVKVGRSDGMAVLEVADTGPGIPEQHAPHVFDRLYRAGQGRTRTDGGTGLGLAIVAAIVHAHGGEVVLDSGGLGATFRVLLPGSEAAPSSL